MVSKRAKPFYSAVILAGCGGVPIIPAFERLKLENGDRFEAVWGLHSETLFQRTNKISNNIILSLVNFNLEFVSFFSIMALRTFYYRRS